jgi:hypothetical protein
MSTDGDDPKDKGRAPPPSTLAGVVPQPAAGRPGLPPPRSTGLPPPRPGSPSQTPPFAPGGQTSRAGSHSQSPPFSQPQAPSPFSQPQAPSPFAPLASNAQPQPVPQAPSQFATPAASAQPPSQPHAQPQPVPQAPSPFATPAASAQPPSQPHAQPQPTPQAPSPLATPAPVGQPVQAMSPPPSGPAWSPYPPPGQAASDPAWVQSHGAAPTAQLVQSESSPIEQLAEVAAEVPGRFMAFLKLSAKRAFRIRIEPSEVLPDERQQLLAANPPIADENLQAFLAWRRSVLFLVATSLTVLSIMGLVDSLVGSKVATSVRLVKLLPTLAEVAFCLICWLSLRDWTVWRKQRKWLFVGWLLFMFTPFLVFVYPLKLAVMDAGRALTIEQMRELGYHGVYNRAVAPFAFAMIALLQLAPKVISLMPGLIRSSMVIKLLFPGASAPGWLIVMVAPLYAMIFYAILIVPYQFTASGWFIFGVALVMLAQGLVTRSGFALARPLTQTEALAHIARVRKFYVVLLVTGLVSIVGGLGMLVQLLHMKWTTVVTTVLKFESNVMILTTIGADVVVTNLDRARGYTEGKEHIEEETELKIAAFVGLNAPPTPPPPGPAQP